MAVFDRCFAYVGGKPLGMASGGTLEAQGDPLPVDTMLEELAGVTPVPKHMILSTESFVPSTGFEFDAFESWLLTTEITWRVQFAGNGKSVTFKGYLMAPALKWGAAENTVLSFKAIVKAATFK